MGTGLKMAVEDLAGIDLAQSACAFFPAQQSVFPRTAGMTTASREAVGHGMDVL
jgi:hypothetical protein